MAVNRSAASSTLGSRLTSPQLGAVCTGWDSTHRSDRSMSDCSRCGSYQVRQSPCQATLRPRDRNRVLEPRNIVPLISGIQGAIRSIASP